MELTPDIITALIAGGATLIGATVGYFVNKKMNVLQNKKTAAETEAIELDNIKKANQLWERITVELQKQIGVLREEIKLSNGKIDGLNELVLSLKQIIEDLKTEVLKLAGDNSGLLRTIASMQVEIKDLRQKIADLEAFYSQK